MPFWRGKLGQKQAHEGRQSDDTQEEDVMGSAMGPQNAKDSLRASVTIWERGHHESMKQNAKDHLHISDTSGDNRELS